MSENKIRKPRDYSCEDCKEKSDCPMIDDRIWLAIATPKTLLCLKCTEKRLGRAVEFSDFKDCIGNDSIMKILDMYGIDITDYEGYERLKTRLLSKKV